MHVSLFLLDGLYSAMAAIGFAAISNPPAKAYKYIALTAAAGHTGRLALMECLNCHIIPASFAGAILIGLFSILIARQIRCVPETLSYPAMLPMIPGIFAYRSIQALWMMLTPGEEPMFMHYSYLALYNGMTATFIIFAMVVGHVCPTILLQRYVFTSTKYLWN